MEKPLSIRREDFIQALIKTVNECGLPPCVALEVLKGIVQEVAQAAQNQLEADRAAWEARDEQ